MKMFKFRKWKKKEKEELNNEELMINNENI